MLNCALGVADGAAAVEQRRAAVHRVQVQPMRLPRAAAAAEHALKLRPRIGPPLREGSELFDSSLKVRLWVFTVIHSESTPTDSAPSSAHPADAVSKQRRL